ncbi:hypothetical protein [Oleiharenicola lentus]
MNDRESRRYEKVNRVRAFGQDYASEFPAGSRAPTHFTAAA